MLVLPARNSSWGLTEPSNQNKNHSIGQCRRSKIPRRRWMVPVWLVISAWCVDPVYPFAIPGRIVPPASHPRTVHSMLSEMDDRVDENRDGHSSKTFSASSMGGIEPQLVVMSDTENETTEAVEWDVYVDQSKPSLERGASATLDAFTSLAPPQVKVHPAILPKSNKSKVPYIRCIFHEGLEDAKALEVGNLDSVDKVYRVLTYHMRVKGVDYEVRECLKWKYKGNEHLESEEIPQAIEAYGKALNTGVVAQEGMVLLMRANAYLKRAASHRKELKELVNDFAQSVPETSKLELLYDEAEEFPTLAGSIFRRVLADTKNQEKKMQQIKYRHGLYQYALLQAAQDSLRATQLLPFYAKSWLQAGEILSELWKLKESAQYYEKARETDSSLTNKLTPVIDRLRNRQELLENARSYGWSEDSFRLALDVAE